MNQLTLWIHTPFAQALGWTLLHFVWEGTVLGAMFGAGLWLMRPAPARHRYALACALLAAMPLAFAGTLAVMWSLQPAPIPLVLTASPLGAAPATPVTVQDALPAPRLSMNRLAWLSPLWMVGVAFFYVRGMAGWIGMQRLRRRGVCSPPPEWQARLDELAARLHLSRPVALLESCFADTPVLIGYLRPVVLLPLGCLTGFSAGQLESILLHELAHVRRHDYVVNLLQSGVEGLLFYHPAVWWASAVVRAERENCCDDTVVEMMGDARSYAATLATLEERRATAPRAALAATGGNLMKRIRRLSGEPRGVQTSVAPAASAGVLLLLVAAGLAALPAKLPAPRRASPALPVAGVALQVATPQAQPAADPKPQAELANPYQKWLNEDVAYIITDEERAAFKKLQSDLIERETFIENFWLRRDPTPGTVANEFKEEHYRRIAYTNEHYSSRIPGWKTDRGRIYITYGPPDEIEDHTSGGSYRRPAEEGGGETSTVPFQKWRYRYLEGIGSNVIIEFVDSAMSGEFRMTMDPSEKEALPGPPKAAQEAKVSGSRGSQTAPLVVPPGGKIPVVTPAQVAALLGRVPVRRDAIVRIEQTAGVDGQSVTFHVALDALGANFHVYGQVTQANKLVVASFDEDVHDQPAVAKTLSMRSGAYHLTVVTKNMATGLVRTAALDFTVD
jgi:GWxTD domain-containing protein